MKDKKTVFVGMSGGVDSSVSAVLLKEQGYNVVGVFIRTWSPDFIECTWKSERRDAMRVCAHLDIPFLECDGEEAYKKGVAEYMISEYEKGKTPNPDVMCNREVKFGVFWNFAKKHGADFIATGHYAQNIHETKTNNYELKKGGDDSKDQSYFLWTLTQNDLSHVLFPVGHLKKIEVRKIAKKYKLPTAIKKDSQGVCFLGPLDMKEFLKHYIKSEQGNVLDENGEVIGNHDGSMFFTLGERHGFVITKKKNKDTPYYVINKNIENNTIVVSHNQEKKSNDIKNKYVLEKINWISYLPKYNKESLSHIDNMYEAQIRYHGELLQCSIKMSSIPGIVEISFIKNILVDSGQSIVIYDGDTCLGGGVVV